MHRSLPKKCSLSSKEINQTVSQVSTAKSSTFSNEHNNTLISLMLGILILLNICIFLIPSPFANYDNSAIYNQSKGFVITASSLLIIRSNVEIVQ